MWDSEALPGIPIHIRVSEDEADINVNYKGLTMKKSELIGIIKRILKSESDLDFLSKLDEAELTILVAIIRDRIEGVKNG